MLASCSIFSLGDAALTVDFGNGIDEETNARVLQLFQKLRGFSPSIIDLVPAYSSLAIYYDTVALRSKERSAFDAMKETIERILHEETKAVQPQSRKLKIPVCYAKNFALDIEALAVTKNLS